MTRKYFGTDGIRGRANGVITPELAFKRRPGGGPAVPARRPPAPGGDRQGHAPLRLHDRDRRWRPASPRSAWTCSCSARCRRPAVAMLTRSMRADLGVMISASHNPFEDNGIKLFGPDGFKLSDDVEREIEALMDAEISAQLAALGASSAAPSASTSVHARYIEFAKRTLPRAARPRGHARRRRLRQRRRLQGRARGAVGARRRGRRHRRRAGRLQHQPRRRLDRARGADPARCASCAPTSASRSTATPTGC